MVFGLSSSEPQAIHQRSSAIGNEISTKREIWKPGEHESGKKEMFCAAGALECGGLTPF